MKNFAAIAAFSSFIGICNAAYAVEQPSATAPSQTASAPVAKSCLVAPAKMSNDDIQSFLSTPAKLLSDNPTGGMPLSNTVRELAASSSDAFDAVMKLLPGANDAQKSAIAAGLARAVAVCGTVDQEYAAQIQNAVATLGDATVIAAFAQASNDIKVAAVGAAGSASASGGGSTTDDGSSSAANNYQYSSEGGIDTSSGSYSIGANSTSIQGDTITTTDPSTVEVIN